MRLISRLQRLLPALALATLGAAASATAQPVTGRIELGNVPFFSSGASSVFRSEVLLLPNPFDPVGDPARLFGTISADLVDGAIRGEQALRIPWSSLQQVEVFGRVSPIVRIEPEPGVTPRSIQVALDLFVSADFLIDKFLFGPAGSASNTFDAFLAMRSVSSNSGTLVRASYRYSWTSDNSSTGVTDSFSHTPTTFEAGAAFDATVERFGPLQSEYMQGFKNIGLHIEFPYVPASGTLIELTADVLGILSGRDAGQSGDWVNSALLDLHLPPGYFLADSDGNRLAFNWDGTGGNGVPAVPEPETWLLFAAGAALLALKRRHRRQDPREMPLGPGR